MADDKIDQNCEGEIASASTNAAWRNYLAHKAKKEETIVNEAPVIEHIGLSPSHPRSSRWSTIDDLRKHFKEINDKNAVGGGLAVFSEMGVDGGRGTFVDTSSYHSVIVAATGAGKTRKVLMPTVLSLMGESMVLNDPKGEIAEMFYGMLIENGYDVRILNLRDPAAGHCWNPFSQPYRLWHRGKEDEARGMLMDLVSTLVPPSKSTDQYWPEAERATLFGMMCVMVGRASSEDECNFYSLSVFMSMVFADQSSMEELIDSLDPHSMENMSLSTVLVNADSTRKCILSTVRASLNPFVMRADINRMLSSNDFDMSTLGKRKTAYFLISSDEKDTYNAIIGRFIEQMNMMLFSEAYGSENKALPIRVNVLLDEMTSLTHIKNIPNMLVAGRSRNVRYTLVLQSVSQLSIYGDQEKNILPNCQNWIYLGGRDLDFAEKLCKLCGVDERGEPLVTMSQLLYMEEGEALVLSGRMYPFMSRLADISMYEVGEAVPIPRYEHPDPVAIGEYAIHGPLTDDTDRSESDGDEADTELDSESLTDLFGDFEDCIPKIGPSTEFFDHSDLCLYFEAKCNKELNIGDAVTLMKLAKLLKYDIEITEFMSVIEAACEEDDSMLIGFLLNEYISPDNLKKVSECAKEVVRDIKKYFVESE